MGRHIDSVCKLCRREGVKLYLKSTRCDSPKCPMERKGGGGGPDRSRPPGMHGGRRSKLSEYGIRLREKQKLKRFYGVFERQFRRYFELASRSPENTGEVLLTIMERRLDNVLFRLGFAPNRAGARQMVTHGHVLLNDRVCTIPSLLVKVNDTIKVKNRPHSLNLARASLQIAHDVPKFLQRSEGEQPEGRMLCLPARDDVDPNIGGIEEQLIIEVCSR
jgi:small subunit ribosomal protein S4